MKSKEICTLPNLLSVIRLACVPVTVMLIFRVKMIAAFIVFAFAEITDLVDGYIARKFDQISKIGIFLDPLADKLMAIGVLAAFTICDIVPLPVVLILMAKELLMLIGGIIMLKKGHSAPSNKSGKVCAFIMNVAIATGFFAVSPLWAKIYPYVIYIGLAFSVSAMVQYCVKNIRLIFGPKETEIESSK